MLTLKCKLVAVQDGTYTNYVFEDVDKELNSELKYIACTKPPNWNYSTELKIGDVGYLTCKFVEAGVTQWYNPEQKDFCVYNYTNCYFINFIKVQENISNKEFTF